MYPLKWTLVRGCFGISRQRGCRSQRVLGNKMNVHLNYLPDISQLSVIFARYLKMPMMNPCEGRECLKTEGSCRALCQSLHQPHHHFSHSACDGGHKGAGRKLPPHPHPTQFRMLHKVNSALSGEIDIDTFQINCDKKS